MSGSSASKLVSSVYKVGEDQLHVSSAGRWLKSRFHFAFASWFYGPPGFGCLRVLNDDLVLAQKGFGLHPHRHMEIFSYVLEGHLSHGDTEENRETLGRGDIQFMSAGDGVMHEEYNRDTHNTCRFIQTWIVPDVTHYDDSEVRYGSVRLRRSDRLNALFHAIGPLPVEKGKATTGSSDAVATAHSKKRKKKKPKKKPDTTTMDSAVTDTCADSGSAEVKSKSPPIAFRRDVNVYVSELEKAKTVSFEVSTGRQAYVVCVEGTMDVSVTVASGHSVEDTSGMCDDIIAVDSSAVKEDATTKKVSLLNREAVMLFGPLAVVFTATGEGVDGSGMRHPLGGDGAHRSEHGIGFVNGDNRRVQMDSSEDIKGVDIYQSAHFMLLEMNKSRPYREGLSS